MAAAAALMLAPASAQDLYEEEPLASRAIREQQWRQWDAYLRALGPGVDFSSPEAYAESVEPLRRRFQASIGFPAPRFRSKVKARLEKFAEDNAATYYRCYIPVTPELETYGLYIVPKNTAGPAPLVISQHGGGGFPEMATFKGGTNYRDMVRGAVTQGYVVFAPLMIMYPYVDRDHNTPIPEAIRQTLTEELLWRGTTLGAVEAAKLSRALDLLLSRREIDPKRVAMVGLSLGGSHTVLTSALDPRIQAAVVSGSPSVENAHLICPRPVQFQFGNNDRLLAAGSARTKSALDRLAKLYQKVGASERFEYKVFEGGHEFRGDIAWEFLKKHLK